MKYFEKIKCMVCGGRLEKQESGIYKCAYCDAKFERCDVDEYLKKIELSLKDAATAALVTQRVSLRILIDQLNKINVDSYELNFVKDILNSVTEIGACTFHGCTSLTSMVIPNSVTYIGGYAFSNCTSLTNVVFENTSSWKAGSSSISSSALADPATAAIYLKSTYDERNWER